MVRKKFGVVVAMLAFVLVFGMTVVGCKDNPIGEVGGNNTTAKYTEGDVYITALGAMAHYYFSTTPEGIEQAAHDNGISYINPPIKNAFWTLNSLLDSNVKNAMDSRGASYSAAVYVESGTTKIAVNKKSGGSYYTVIYTLT